MRPRCLATAVSLCPQTDRRISLPALARGQVLVSPRPASLSTSSPPRPPRLLPTLALARPHRTLRARSNRIRCSSSATRAHHPSLPASRRSAAWAAWLSPPHRRPSKPFSHNSPALSFSLCSRRKRLSSRRATLYPPHRWRRGQTARSQHQISSSSNRGRGKRRTLLQIL